MMQSVAAIARRKANASSGPFDPLSLSPALWLDASDPDTLFDSSGGSALVLADGAVARWEDKSGNARHPIQDALGSRPIRKTNIQNGLDVLRFDGVNDYLVLAAGLGTRSGITVFAVYSIPSLVSDHVFVAGEWNTGGFAGTSEWLIDSFGDTGANQGRPSFRVEIGTTTAVVEESATRLAEFIVVTGRHDGSNVTVWVDGVQKDTTAASGTINQVSGRQFYVGSLHATGTPGNFGFGGDICELLVYPSNLSDVNRAAVEAYLATKWGT